MRGAGIDPAGGGLSRQTGWKIAFIKKSCQPLPSHELGAAVGIDRLLRRRLEAEDYGDAPRDALARLDLPGKRWVFGLILAVAAFLACATCSW